MHYLAIHTFTVHPKAVSIYIALSKSLKLVAFRVSSLNLVII